jgi:hypothetical protein|tara:strand:- start:240 stop:575 length:336 start_codon:yes stop_codon:yes gene_type:complete
MYSWIIKISVISLVLIYLVHHLYDFFVKNLTTPKIKDLVNQPQHKYDEILKKMNTAEETKNNTIINSKTEKLNEEQNNNMKLELKNFLNSELKKNSTVDFANQESLQYSTF